jgi:hypothetical protein
MIYRAPLDKSAKAITISVTILFAIIIGGQFSLVKDEGRGIQIYTTSACLIIYFITFVFRPINYITTNDKLIIRRLILDVKVDKTKIQHAEILDKEKIKGSIRTFGVGGFFGYFGNFANFSIGKMTWYATRKDKIVLVRTIENEKIILTPNEPEKFIADILSQDNIPATNKKYL